ncbi:MAG: iron chelate uptake ABC transporter family permease subunit [Deltaproteobacteria bacterium]|nr:iron chelate uptake ABC transporter family permease subunit [Deltaproteobacteria bacterium]
MTVYRLIRINSILIILLIGVGAIAMFAGAVNVDIGPAIRSIFSSELNGDNALAAIDKTILFSIRLPRIILAGLVGAALSLAGTIFQALLRNPLADPYILGLSGGSAVGAILGIMIGAGSFVIGIPGAAFSGAIIAVVTVFGIAGTHLQSNTILLAGVIVNAFFSAVILFLISVSSRFNLQNMIFWLMGDLSLPSTGGLQTLAVCLIIGFAVIYTESKALNLIATGEETALQLGINVQRSKIVLFITASLITAVAVSFSGMVGFVGLIIPHMMRLMVGPDHRILLPASLLFGASFLITADAFARMIMAPVELPVGVITAFCGAPYFIYLLRRRTL